MTIVTVKKGDCLSNIAARHGFTWQMVWQLPENAPLRAQRKDPNILYVGDKVFVPTREDQRLDAATTMRHRYVVDVEPTFFKLRFLFQSVPRPNLRWVFETASATESGVTDADGALEVRIDPQAATGMLTLYPPSGEPETYEVFMGALDPVDMLTGVQQRLANLGYDPGEIDGLDGPRTQGAVRRFQTRYKLLVDGKAGPQTKDFLTQVHGG